MFSLLRHRLKAKPVDSGLLPPSIPDPEAGDDGGAGGPTRAQIALVVAVAALGYFVDIYDLVLFLVVRDPSLASLGYADDALIKVGTNLFNWQMSGLLVGGILWGILGDKRGRLTVLFGSIFLYSIANILNGFVVDTEWYAVLRFVAGIGLAGELGAGVTLVAELMSPRTRGWGTTIIAAFGLLGAVAASQVAGADWSALLGVATESWRVAYFIGGGMGLLLLLLRVRMAESGMFKAAEQANVSRGNFLQLFANRATLLRYVQCIAIGVPIWYVIGVLVAYSNKIGEEAGLAPGTVVVGTAVMWAYIGLSAGDVASGLLSQLLGSRKRAVGAFMLLSVAVTGLYLLAGTLSLTAVYALCFALGFSGGYWAMFVTIGSEQFGTNIRATVTTTVPNFVRGAVVPMTLAYGVLFPSLSHHGAAAAVGVVAFALGLWALAGLPETFGKNLDYYEGS